MSSAVQKLKSLKLGQLLLVETIDDQLLVGTLKSLNTTYLMIELDNIRDIKTNYIYQSSQLLAYTQMKNIKLILNESDIKNQMESSVGDTDDNTKTTNSNNSSICHSSSTSLENSCNSKEQSQCLNIQLTALDLTDLRSQLDNITFINQTDQKYHKALSDIKRQSVIGLLIEPIEMGRDHKTSVVAVSTPQNIYIFDMLALGKIFKEFRLILESEKPRKAVHYSNKVADHLKYHHDILLKGIFDTFLAYCVVTNEKINATLEETIQKTLNISDVYFQPDNVPNSYHRPMPHEKRTNIAKKVVLQLKLYEHLLHEYMLKSFYNQCEQFSQIFYNNDDNFEVGQQSQPHSRAGFEHIQPNGNWKDKLNVDLNLLK